MDEVVQLSEDSLVNFCRLLEEFSEDGGQGRGRFLTGTCGKDSSVRPWKSDLGSAQPASGAHG